MSYILDALRRADSERERGAVPSVHAQPVPLGSAVARPPPSSRLWVSVSLVLAALLLLMLGWQWWGHDAAPEAGVAPQAAAPLPIAPPPVPSLPSANTAPAVVTAVPATPSLTPPAVASAVAPVVPQAVAVAVRKPALPAKPAASVMPRAVATAATAASSINGPAAALAASRLPTASELPEDIQRGLPNLVVGGASYSQNAESRMLIVNGQVLREGDKVAPEVTLEEIRLKEAVLSTKGRRYRIAY
jgi:general secretion pathway protein B